MSTDTSRPRTETATARRAFTDAMQDLYDQAGQPAERSIADQAGLPVRIVRVVVHGYDILGWPVTEKLVTALGGDKDRIRALYNAAPPPRRTALAEEATRLP